MKHIEDCLSFYLSKAYQQVTQAAKQRLEPYRVTPAQYAVLKVLWERDEQTGAQLGERLVLDSATITGLLDRLEHSGFVMRRPHATDRRMNIIALTAEGRALHEPLDREMDAMNRDFLGGLSSDEARTLRQRLTAIAANGEAARDRSRKGER